jgi:glycosyltransferase involved in cell wall biosynthesis
VNPWAREPADLATWLDAARATPGLKLPGTIRYYLPYAAALRGLDLDTYDLIWAERPHMARLCNRVRARTIMDLDDVEHVRLERALAVRGGGLSLGRLRELYRYRIYRRLELSWSRGFLASVVCSEHDRRYLEAHGCGNGAVVPNGVPLVDGAAAGRPPPAPGAPLRMAFLGNMLHAPNLDAVEYLVSRILPLLRQADPAATLDVLGPGASPELVLHHAGQVTYRGFVAELCPALAAYDVLVAPIRFGSGTKVKLLDAMASRIPIVTTAVGAEGLSIEDGRHALLAETPEAFAAQVLAVKRDPALALRLTDAAHALVAERFSSAAVRDGLAAWLEGLAAPAGYDGSGSGIPKSGLSRSPSTQR